MSWEDSIKIKPKTDKKVSNSKYEYPVLKLEDGYHKVRIVEVPTQPTEGKYGRILRFIVEKDGQRYAWLVSFKSEVDENSLLGQLLKVKQETGSLVGRTLLLTVRRREDRVYYRVYSKCPICGRSFDDAGK